MNIQSLNAQPNVSIPTRKCDSCGGIMEAGISEAGWVWFCCTKEGCIDRYGMHAPTMDETTQTLAATKARLEKAEKRCEALESENSVLKTQNTNLMTQLSDRR